MTFPSELQTLIDEGRFAVRGLIQFRFGGGTKGVWNGPDYFEHEGVTYKPNSLISVQDIAAGLGTAAAPITIEMPASADFGLTPDMLANIESEEYKGRTVLIGDAYFHPDTRELLHVEWNYEGRIDTIDHVVESGTMRLVANVETRALDNHRDGYRMASHEDQQLVSPGDMFFEHAAKVPFETFPITLG